MRKIFTAIRNFIVPPPSDAVEAIIEEIGGMIEALAVYDAVQKNKNEVLAADIERLGLERKAVQKAAFRADNLRRLLDKVYDGE